MPAPLAASEAAPALQSGAWGDAAHAIVQLLRGLDPYMPV